MKFHLFTQNRPFVGVLSKMIIGDVAKTVSAVLGVLTLIIVSRRFISILGKAIEGEVAGGVIFALLGLKTLTTLVQLLPVALFISVLMVFGRMHRDNEMAVLSAGGVGIGFFCRSVLLLVIPLAGLAGFLSLKLLPWSEAQAQMLVTRAESVMDVRGLAAGQFNEHSDGDLVFFIQDIDASQQMTNVFVQHRKGEQLEVVVSESGRVVDLPDGRYIVLENGTRYEGSPGQADYIITEYDEYALRISQPENRQIETKREGTPSLMLLESDSVKDVAEFQNRLSVPLGALILSILAVPLSKVSPRGGMYGNLFSAILIYIIYGNMLRIVEVWALEGVMSIWAGYVLVYGVIAMGVGWMIAKAAGWRLKKRSQFSATKNMA